MKKTMCILTSALLALSLLGCSAAETQPRSADAPAEAEVLTLESAQTPDAEDAEDAPLRSMILALQGDSYLLVVQESGLPFVSALDAELLGPDGEALEREALSAGDIVDVYGDGAMTRSYPAQYNGVTRVQLVSEGEAADTAAYQELLDRFAPASAPSAASADAEAGVVNRAMAIPFGEDGLLFVDQDSGMVFTATLPEEIYGLNGEKIAAADIARGNIVEITGNGIMAQSYPGQYPGVTKIQVVAEGAPEDADAYQEIVDSIYVEPDPAEPASLQLQYHIPEAIVMTGATRGGYTWTDEGDEESSAVIACGLHPLQMDLVALNLKEATEVELHFYPQEATAVRAVRWPDSLMSAEDLSAVGDGEAVTVDLSGEVPVLTAEPGYVYAVYADFDAGSVEYAFLAGDKAE